MRNKITKNRGTESQPCCSFVTILQSDLDTQRTVHLIIWNVLFLMRTASQYLRESNSLAGLFLQTKQETWVRQYVLIKHVQHE